MMPISIKITIPFVISYFIILSILLVLTYNFIGPIVFTTFLSIIPVTFFIKEVRVSLSERLNYLQDNFISSIYVSLNFYNDDYLNSYFSEAVGEIREKQHNLKKYSHFIGVSLVPKNILAKNDIFILMRASFFEKVKLLLDKVYENMKAQGVDSSSNFEKYRILECLGFKVNVTSALYEKDTVYLATKKLEKENPQLITEIRTSINAIQKMKNEILLELDDFYRSNSLRIPTERMPKSLALSLAGLS